MRTGSSEIVIRAEGLGKRYRIGTGPQERYRTLRDTLAGTFLAPFRGRRSLRGKAGLASQGGGEGDVEGRARGENGYIWALKDVSFEVKRGEVVGIIGRNGAGKSTLLKILSRITEPTEGRAEIRGRVGSLLEVGTGFHPELTGRENIYLSGALLGMKRHEIDRRFDEIVEFAEIGPFLDTPVKRYSSGMSVRLAFAVAAHLEPEILLVDEVLAVGDAAFQKKCLGKMGDVAKEGRTVLFVSHNMGAISSLCDKLLVLKDGRPNYFGGVSQGITGYLKETVNSGQVLAAPGGFEVVLDTRNNHGEKVNAWNVEDELFIYLTFRSQRKIWEPAFDITFYNEDGIKIFTLETDRLTNKYRGKFTKEATFAFCLRNVNLACEYLTIDLGLKSGSLPYLFVWKNVKTIFLSCNASSFPKKGILYVPVSVVEGGS